MKNISKKLISTLLAFAMVLSCIPAITLAARAEEVSITRPTGISIVEDYDTYVGEDWASNLSLPETVTVGETAAAVTWADVADYVDPGTVGYYFLPGTVNGVANAVTITIQVREKVNLLTQGYMEGTKDDITGAFSIGGSTTVIAAPVVEGKQAIQVTLTGTKNTTQALHNNKNSGTTTLAGAVTGGTYYCGIWAQSSYSASVGIYVKTKASTSDESYTTALNASNVSLGGDAYASSGGTVTLTSGLANILVYAQYTVTQERKDSGEVVTNDVVNFDCLEFINIDVCELETEPVTITDVTYDAAPIAIVENYDSYVADWTGENGLNLPSTVTVTGSDAVAYTADITWDYTVLGDLSTVGKYTLTGTLSSDEVINPLGLTVRQTVYVRPCNNLLTNGNFDNGTTSWKGLNLSKTADPLNADNSVLLSKTTDTYKINENDTKQTLYTDMGKDTLKGALSAQGAGQYALQIKAMPAAFDSSSAAREDLRMRIYLRCYNATSDTAVCNYKSDYVYMTSTTSWTTCRLLIDLTDDLTNNTYTGYRADAYCTSENSTVSDSTSTFDNSGALYLDDFELLLIKQTLGSVPSDLPIVGASADLDNTLAMNFYIDQDQLTDGETYTADINGTRVTVDPTNTDSTDYCYVSFAGLAAKEMGDTVTVTLYDSENNTVAVWMDSFKDYVERLMAQETEDSKLQTLCVDLLNYGAAAQQTFNYNVNDLVNADLADDATGTTGITAENTATGTWAGTTLTLENSITMELFFAKDVLTEGAEATVSYTSHTGANVSETVTVSLDAYYDMWSVKVDDLVLADVNTVVTVAVGDYTVTDSMASYVARIKGKGNTDALYDAILAVGASAYAYFHQDTAEQ